MKYYYLDGVEKLGPYSLEEIKSRNLSHDTMVLREDKVKWSLLSSFEELSENINENPYSVKTETVKTQIESKQDKKSNEFLKFVIPSAVILIVSFFIYQRFSFSENEAKDIANRFFNAIIMENLDYNIIDEVYPDFKSIGSRIAFQNACVINNIFYNSNGDYEVYAVYNHSQNKSYPIYLLTEKKNGNVIIKSSRGINYAFYDKTFDYGKKKGCFSNREDDVEIGKIISDKNLKSNFEYFIDIEFLNLYDNLEISIKLSTDYTSYTSGDVTIRNKNHVDFKFSEFDCRVEFYDRNNKLTYTKKLSFYDLGSQKSSTETIFFHNINNSTNYKVIRTINRSDRIIDLIKDKVIEETEYSCL